MTAPMEPEFVDPPPPGRRSVEDQWIPTRDALIKRSGDWALIMTGHWSTVGSLASRIRKSRGVWAGHEWDVTMRNTLSETDAKVYARHIKPLNIEGDEQQ